MSNEPIHISLKFEPLDASNGDQRGIYIKTINHFENFIVNVGTAGEGTYDRLRHRLAFHEKNILLTGGGTRIHIDTDQDPKSYQTYLKRWRQASMANFPADLVFVPGMPQSYPFDPKVAQEVNRAMFTYFVAPIDLNDPNFHLGFDKDWAKALKAVESRIQTLLRSFIVYVTGDPDFPLRMTIKGKGKERADSLMLGQSHESDLLNSDRIIIDQIEFPFENSFSEAFRAFVLKAQTEAVRRYGLIIRVS